MIIEKRVVPFPPLEVELSAVEGKIKPYHRSFRLANYLVGDKGKKILIVSDRVAMRDIENSEILAGEESGTFERVLNYSLKEAAKEGAKVKEVVVFNWQFGHVKTSGKNNKVDAANKTATNDIFFARFKRFLKRYKPDEIIISGLDLFEFIATSCTQNFKLKHLLYFNRRVKFEFDGVKYPVIGTLDYFRMCSYDGKYTNSYPWFLGYFSKALVTASNGRNRYVPKIVRDRIKFRTITTIKQFKSFFKQLKKQPIIAIDTEGSGLAKLHTKLFCIQFAWTKEEAWFLPLDHPDTPFSPKELEYIKRRMKWYFEQGKSKYHIYHTAKFDVTQFYSQLGIKFYNHRLYDIAAGEFTLEENRKLLKIVGFNSKQGYGPYSLNTICEHYGITIYRDIEFSKGDRGNIATEGLTERFIEYSCYDVIVLLWLQEFQIKEAKRTGHKKFLKFVCEQLSDTILAFTQMELAGAAIDKKHMWKLQSTDGPISQAIRDAKNSFRKSPAAQKVNNYLLKKKGIPRGVTLFGDGNTWYFDIDKQEHQQLLFFKALDLEVINETKAGGGKVDKLFKSKYKDTPEVAAFLTYKKNRTIKDTFVGGISSKLLDDADCRFDYRIRSSYDYTDVTTGRTSSRNPNLQNIPSHGDLAKVIKKLFIASKGCIIIKNDYSAHEVRDWANESHDEAISAAFYQGLKYRQELRIAAFEDDKSAAFWTKVKSEVKWDDITKDKSLNGKQMYEKKKKILKTITHKGVKFIAEIELELEVKGDVHKLNCERFFKVSVLEVTDEQRQGVKAVVFGVIYGKGAASLGESLKQTEEYAQNIIDTMFREFRRGGEWIEGIHELGQRNLYVESPLGMRRHLWGYLHARKSVVNAMNRRGPNSIIQGMASFIGVSSIRLMQQLIWHFFTKHDVPFHWMSATNYVHDSVESETKFHTAPIYLYLIEHASTTLIHKRFSEVFGYELTIGLELEFQIGASLDRVKKWNFMRDSLFHTLETEIDYRNAEFDDKINKDKELKAAAVNWNIVSDLRLRELKQAVKSKEPSKLMLMTPENARNIGLRIY